MAEVAEDPSPGELISPAQARELLADVQADLAGSQQRRPPWKAFVERGARPEEVPLLLATLRCLSGHRSGQGGRSEASLLELLDAEPALVESVHWVIDEVSPCRLISDEALALAHHLLSARSCTQALAFLHQLLFEPLTERTPRAVRRLRKALFRERRERAERGEPRRCPQAELRLLLQGSSEVPGHGPDVESLPGASPGAWARRDHETREPA